MRWRRRKPDEHEHAADTERTQMEKVVHEQVKRETAELDRRVSDLESFADAVVTTYNVILEQEAKDDAS